MSFHSFRTRILLFEWFFSDWNESGKTTSNWRNEDFLEPDVNRLKKILVWKFRIPTFRICMSSGEKRVMEAYVWRENQCKWESNMCTRCVLVSVNSSGWVHRPTETNIHLQKLKIGFQIEGLMKNYAKFTSVFRLLVVKAIRFLMNKKWAESLGNTQVSQLRKWTQIWIYWKT